MIKHPIRTLVFLFPLMYASVAFTQISDFPTTSVTHEDLRQSKVFTIHKRVNSQQNLGHVQNIEEASDILQKSKSEINNKTELKSLKQDGVLQYRKGIFGIGSRDKYVKSNGAIIAADIERDDAIWLRFKFTEAMLKNISTVKIISNEINSVQEFTPELLKSWEHTSSIVPSNKARVLITLLPNSKLKPSDLSIDDFLSEVETGNIDSLKSKMVSREENNYEETQVEHATASEEGVCDPDERQLNLAPTFGRSTKFCTVFRLEKNIFASAGHCFRSKKDASGNIKKQNQSVVFNVPKSNELGIPQFPTPIEEFSFPVIMDSVKCDDCVAGINKPHGEDWAIFILGRSPTKQKLLPEDKLSFPDYITDYNLKPGDYEDAISLIGFGLDSEPQSNSLALQKSIGKGFTITRNSEKNVTLKHFADTQSGNSGSPIFKTAANNSLIAIHTGGKCNPGSDKPNFGTALSNSHLKSEIKKLRNEINDGKYDSILNPL